MPQDISKSEDHSITTILVAVYALLIVLSFYASYRFTVWGTTDSLRNFAAVVTVGLAAVSAIMGIVTGFFSLHRSQRAAAELEILKSRLQVEVLSNKVVSDLTFEAEKLKATAQSTAYAKLWTAVDSAYLSLAKLETATWKPEDMALMDQLLREAHSQLVNTRSDEHRDLWLKVRQRAIFIAEQATTDSGAKQSDLWKKNVAEFAAFCQQFKDIAQTEIYRPPSIQQPKSE